MGFYRAPFFETTAVLVGLAGQRAEGAGSRVEESVDGKLNVVACWKVGECELRDVIESFMFPISTFTSFEFFCAI